MHRNAWLSSTLWSPAEGRPGRLLLTAAILVVWALLMAIGAAAGYWKLVGISVLAFAAMMAGVAAAVWLAADARWRLWGDGIAAGAMVASACLFLLPMALGGEPTEGGLGTVAGLLAGAGLQALAWMMTYQNTPRFESSLTAISLHALAAGFVIGLVYARMPALGPVLGVGIVAHKLPAGYALARSLQRHAMARHAVVWPACGLGLACMPTGLFVAPGGLAQDAAIFGFATGIFLYVGISFLTPRPGQRDGGKKRIGAAVLGAVLVLLLQHAVG